MPINISLLIIIYYGHWFCAPTVKWNAARKLISLYVFQVRLQIVNVLWKVVKIYLPNKRGKMSLPGSDPFSGNELKLVLSEIDPKTDRRYKNNWHCQLLIIACCALYEASRYNPNSCSYLLWNTLSASSPDYFDF